MVTKFVLNIKSTGTLLVAWLAAIRATKEDGSGGTIDQWPTYINDILFHVSVFVRVINSVSPVVFRVVIADKLYHIGLLIAWTYFNIY